MKRIMLVLISVVMLFTACKNKANNVSESTTEHISHTQISPKEEFGGIMFGISDKDFLAAIDRKPDYTHKYSSLAYEYTDETCFNVSNADVTYNFDDNNKLEKIEFIYYYLDEADQEKVPIDCAIIKKELLERYPEEVHTYFYDDETFLIIQTESREIDLYCGERMIEVSIKYAENKKMSETIDHSEHFDSITFGMSKEEVIEIVGRQPDENELLTILGGLSYDDELCFNVSNANVQYNFRDDMLYRIQISYFYPPGSEEQLSIDFDTIKEELLIFYPEETRRSFLDEGTELSFYVKNAYVTLSSETYVDIIMVTMEKKYSS